MPILLDTMIFPVCWTQSIYFNGQATSQFIERYMSYDLNGKILALQCIKSGTSKDTLKYTHIDNRLTVIAK